MIDFDRFVEAVKQQMQPAGRAQHLAGTLEELLPFIPDEVTLADLAEGWYLLARPKTQNEEASIAHRRKICAELSAIATQFTKNEPGNVAGAVKTWQEWQAAFQRSADPHQAAMAKILAREIVELQSAP